jgi:ketosteroid isomerase-like protein
MRLLIPSAVAALTFGSGVAASQEAPAPADAPLVRLVEDFIAAERAFDQARIASLITDDYSEVSPLGELDKREAFLGFYTADKKRPLPETAFSEPLVRRHGNAASIIGRLSFAAPVPAGQPPRTVTVRVSFLAVRQGAGWKLASAHYTPERPKAPPAPPAPPAAN